MSRHRIAFCLPLLVLTLWSPGLMAQEPSPEDASPAPPATTGEDGTTPASPQAPDPHTMTVTWDNGLTMRTLDKRFEVRIFGMLMLNATWIAEDRPFDGILGEVGDGFEVRRGRIGVGGYMYEHLEYKFEVDFAGGSVGATDMYMGLRGLPISARLGHQKEPYSLEQLESARYGVFMERSVATMLVPARNAGLLLADSFGAGRGTWAAGLFRDTEPDGWSSTPGNSYNATARGTYAPTLRDGGRTLLHLGGQVNHRRLDGNLRLTTRPGEHNAPNIIVVNIPATAATFVSVEGAANAGPVGGQGEYHHAWVRSPLRGNPTLRGGYAQAHVFLTGDFRNYRDGVFGQLKPRRNFLESGPGAIQLAARWAQVDVHEGVLAGSPGVLSVVTIAANWWWNPHVRWRVNYDIATLDQVEDDRAHIFHVQASLDW